MTELPSSLVYFGSLASISQVLSKKVLPLLEAHQMNDAFLPDKSSELPFSQKELFEVAAKYIAGAIFGKSVPKGQPNHPLQKAIMRWRLENRFNDEVEVKEALQGLLPPMVEQSYSNAKFSHQSWLDYVSSVRLVPFFEKFQELDLWESKGLNHKGAAIKFRSADDSIFSECRPVHYQRKPATTHEINQYVEQMVGMLHQISDDHPGILLTQNYTHRSNKEWRLLAQSNAETLPFDGDLIQAVYLGALVSQCNAEKLKAHLAKVSPAVNLYHAQCKPNEYALDFIKISEDAQDASAESEK